MDPLVVPVTIMLMHYCSHSCLFGEVLYLLLPDSRRPANWLRLPASPGMHYLLVFESLQIKCKKRSKTVLFAFLMQIIIITM